MTYKWTIAALALLAGVGAASPAWAQDPPRVKVAPRAFTFALSRGRIGVIVKTDVDAQADRVGARIEAVSPGGPAEKAGLKAGDVITRFNGVSLAGADGDDRGRSGPGLKLVRLAQALDAGDTVRVEYRRDGENRSATLVAQAMDASWNIAPPRLGDLEIEPDIRWHIDEDGHGFAHAFGHPWSRLELVSLNPDLAGYFGTQEGVLVVRAPDDDSLSLKGGDVILSIGGRKPTSPSHAMRILRSYDAGETVSIDVMRKQKRTTITWKVPQRREPRLWNPGRQEDKMDFMRNFERQQRHLEQFRQRMNDLEVFRQRWNARQEQLRRRRV
jgi:S1-C subfamily serine protease